MSDHDEAGAEPAGEGAPGPELRGDDFVARLVSDPTSPPQTTLISGYLGASDEEGHTRVYFDPELSDYVDVPNGDILHTEHPGEGPLAAALVWLKRDAQVLHGQAGAARQRAGFFEGRVWQDNFGATAAVQGGPGGLPANNAMRTVDTCMPTDFCPTPVTSPVKCYRPFDVATPRINPTPYVRQPAFGQPIVRNQFVQGGPETMPIQSVAVCAVSAAICRPIRTLRVVECIRPTQIQAICRPIPRSYCPPITINTIPGGGPQWLQGSGGGTDTVLYGSGGGTDTVVYGSGGGTDTVLYGSGGGGTDTVYYGSGQGTDTVLYGSTGGGTDTVFYGSTGGGTDTVWYGSGMMTDTVYYGSGTGTDTVIYGSGGGTDTVVYGSGGIADTVYYGSGQGTDTVHYGSGLMTDTVYYGSGQGTDTVYYGSGGIADTVYYGSGGGADTVVYGSGGGGYAATIYQGGILPTRICPSAACGGFPRRPWRTQVGPCGFPTLGPRGCASAVDACPTRFCPQW